MHPTLRKIHILIIDDSSMMLELVSEMLKIVGFTNITVADSGEKGIEIIRRNSPAIDVIICDWKMHEISGLDVLHFVRDETQSPDMQMPFIMLTGKGEREDVEMARDLGVTEYLIKPFSAKGLFDRIKSIVDKPRQFVVANQYKGPDRRRRKIKPPPDGTFKREEDDEKNTSKKSSP